MAASAGRRRLAALAACVRLDGVRPPLFGAPYDVAAGRSRQVVVGTQDGVPGLHLEVLVIADRHPGPVEEASESNQITSSTGDNEDSLEEGASDCGCTDLDGTPERERNLYEPRFSKSNANLYEDLVKKWTK